MTPECCPMCIKVNRHPPDNSFQVLNPCNSTKMSLVKGVQYCLLCYTQRRTKLWQLCSSTPRSSNSSSDALQLLMIERVCVSLWLLVRTPIGRLSVKETNLSPQGNPATQMVKSVTGCMGLKEIVWSTSNHSPVVQARWEGGMDGKIDTFNFP